MKKYRIPVCEPTLSGKELEYLTKKNNKNSQAKVFKVFQKITAFLHVRCDVLRFERFKLLVLGYNCNFRKILRNAGLLLYRDKGVRWRFR